MWTNRTWAGDRNPGDGRYQCQPAGQLSHSETQTGCFRVCTWDWHYERYGRTWLEKQKLAVHFDILKLMPAFDMVKAQSALAWTKTLTCRQPHPRHLHKSQPQLCYFEQKALFTFPCAKEPHSSYYSTVSLSYSFLNFCGLSRSSGLRVYVGLQEKPEMQNSVWDSSGLNVCNFKILKICTAPTHL